MEIRLLGDFEVSHAGDVIPIRGRKQGTLLARLALTPGEVVPSERIADLLWGDDQPAKPANALQAQVSALRKLLPEPVLATRGNGYALDVRPEDVDVFAFRAAVSEGRRLLAHGDPGAASEVFRDALSLWRGPALVDFTYDEFAQPEIARLEEERHAALEARIDADLACGGHREVLAELELLCDRYPLREQLWGLRMLALYRCGRQADALRAYSEARARLVEDLGLEPGPELRRLEAMILAHDPSLDWEADARPRGDARRGNLRFPLTPLVGRASECKQLADMLQTSRLVTIVGPGGVGKTRLALEAANQIEAADGAWLVELAPVSDREAVATTIAATLSVTSPATSDDSTVPRTVVDEIAASVASRAPLLLLDNCEHHVDEVARIVEELLAVAPGLRVLVTSREALGIPGEVLMPLSPLTLDASIELFSDRAAAVDPGFQLDDVSAATVAEICRRLDGLPLAIELAAARTRALPLAQIASRLEDRFSLLTGGSRTALPRQQTLRAVVDWSFDLLFEDERRLFARLSTFPGGCRLEAAEDVCSDAMLPKADVVDLLARLVDKSLVVADRDGDGSVRYRQLQTLWQYARERLVESGEAADVRDRHAAWYRALAEQAEDGLRGDTGPRWRDRLEPEVDNLRSALDWLIERGEAQSAVNLALGVVWLWFLRAEWHDGARWLRDALEAPGDVPAAVRARGEAWLAYFAAVVEGAGAHAAASERALETLQAVGSGRDIGEACLLLASTLLRGDENVRALDVLEQGRHALEDVSHEWGLAMHDLLRANALARLGEVEEAEVAARASVEAFERLGERWVVIEPLGTMAALHEARGELGAALEVYDRLIASTRELDLPGYLAFWLVWRAALAARLGDERTAMDGFSEAVDIGRNPAVTALALIGLERAAARCGEPLDPASAASERAHDLLRRSGRREGEATALVSVGLCALDRGDHVRAREIAADAAALDAEVTGLLKAGLAMADADHAGAARLLDAWAGRFVPALPGTYVSVLVPDFMRLRAQLDA